jgi:hypothetical protein
MKMSRGATGGALVKLQKSKEVFPVSFKIKIYPPKI